MHQQSLIMSIHVGSLAETVVKSM